MATDAWSRYWSKVDKSGECWLWPATSVDDWDYGVFWHDGRNHKAHRWLWQQTMGPIPKGLYVLHSCDTPRCVRLVHLHLGTHRENMAEMYGRGRGRKVVGEQHHSAKLTDEQVREIRRRHGLGARRGGERQVDLAAEFGVAQGIISKIIRREAWTHV